MPQVRGKPQPAVHTTAFREDARAKPVGDGGQALAICILLVLVTLAVYSPVFRSGFVNYDDSGYVYGNRHIQHGITLQSLRWTFNVGYASNWHPLTWMSHMVDYRLFGAKPMGHHLVNLLLHALNAVLLLFVFRRMTGSLWRSAFVAALFAVHPLHVESVAWVSERKDVLSAFFWMLTMGAYVLYAEKPGLKRYLPVVFLYALGLMAKPMLVTLPLVLLLLDHWPLKRNRPWPSLVLEKTPLLALSAASCLIAFIAQAKGGGIGRLDAYTPGIRIANALVGYVTYLWKMLWPRNLAVFYPHPGDMLSIRAAAASAVLLIAISVIVFSLRRKRPYLTVGWLWFLGTLVPVIGLVQVGGQAIADRYTYVPLIGLFAAVAWIVPAKRAAHILSIAVLVILMILTHIQVGYWQTSVSLFEHALACTSRNYVMEDYLGVALAREGRFDEAAVHHGAALEIAPDYAPANNNLGIILASRGDVDEAIAHFRRAIWIEPGQPMTYFNLAVALEMQGKINEAISEYRKCAAGNPDNPIVYYNLGNALERQGKLDQAGEEYRRALEVDPTFDPAVLGLQRVERWRLGKG